jgi:glycosyltransferase involved in cell wall biosynthesis
MEAIAGEVRLLRTRFPASVNWGLNPRCWMRLSLRERQCCLHPRLHLLFRAATRVLQHAFDINHIFGSPADWFYLQGTRRPSVLTVTTEGVPASPSVLEWVARFVVEWPAARRLLEELGIESDRIELILPPVDLKRFTPTPPPTGPFTVVFASSPDDETWLPARGVPQLLEAARLRPEMRFRLLWRPWGNSLPTVRRWLAELDLRNVELQVGRCRNMAAEYAQAHVVATPFADASRSKPAPNSLIEGLACGRPALVTECVGLADIVRDGHAGSVSPATGEGLAEHLDQLRSNWSERSKHARCLAESCFGAEQFLAGYQRVYEEVLASRCCANRVADGAADLVDSRIRLPSRGSAKL